MSNKSDMKFSLQPTSSKNKLDTILSNLLKEVETPTLKAISNDNGNERLIELMEVKNYPYPLLQCPHLEEKGIGEDCVDCQKLQHDTYKARYLEFVNDKGYAHPYTLKAAFDFYSNLIIQYLLTEADELIDQVFDYCIARGTWSMFYIEAVQARAFVRFKQGKYQESLEYFDKQLDVIGPNEAIYENMALAYSRLGQNKEASKTYARAIHLILQKPAEDQKFSTLLMGLSVVLENIDDSLTVLEESLTMLRVRYDKPHSLMAKTLGAMGDLYMKKNDIVTAEKHFDKAVRIFIDTCGLETPLTSNAMNKHAKALLLLGKKEKAFETFWASLDVWTKVDNNSFDSHIVAEALIALMKERDAENLPAKSFHESSAILERLQRKIQNNPMLANDINSLCLLKFIYELYIFNKEILRALDCCTAFRDGLSQLDPASLGEYAPYREQLLRESIELLSLLENFAKQQQ